MTTPVDDSVPAVNEGASACNYRNVAIPLSKNGHLLKWVDKMARLMQPAAIHWVDGSREEYDTICTQMVERGNFIKLNEELVARLLLCALGRERRRAGRRPYLRLLALEGSGRPDQ